MGGPDLIIIGSSEQAQRALKVQPHLSALSEIHGFWVMVHLDEPESHHLDLKLSFPTCFIQLLIQYSIRQTNKWNWLSRLPLWCDVHMSWNRSVSYPAPGLVLLGWTPGPHQPCAALAVMENGHGQVRSSWFLFHYYWRQSIRACWWLGLFLCECGLCGSQIAHIYSYSYCIYSQSLCTSSFKLFALGIQVSNWSWQESPLKVTRWKQATYHCY